MALSKEGEAEVRELPTNAKLLLNMIEQNSECTTQSSSEGTPRNIEEDQTSATSLSEVVEHTFSNSDANLGEEKKVFDSPYEVVELKKSKKTESKYFSKLVGVDRDAFGELDGQVFILKQFWKSKTNKIIVAQKKKSNTISGYACYFTQPDGSCYLMRIGVRTTSQRKGIGKLLINHLLSEYNGKMELEVSSDNEKGVNFYKRIGLNLASEYTTSEGVNFCKFSSN